MGAITFTYSLACARVQRILAYLALPVKPHAMPVEALLARSTLDLP